MWTLVNRFYNFEMIEREDNFSVKGQNLHYTIFLPIGFWLTILPTQFALDWWVLVWITIASLLTTALLALSHNFEIRIDKQYVLVKLKIWFIPIKIIKTKTKDLIVNDIKINDIQIISQRKDYYTDDLKNNLRFSYIMPFDGDKWIFYIDYLGREIYFDIGCDELAWNSILEGLRNLDRKNNS